MRQVDVHSQIRIQRGCPTSRVLWENLNMSEELVSSQAVGGIPSLTEGQIFQRGVTELVLFYSNFAWCSIGQASSALVLNLEGT